MIEMTIEEALAWAYANKKKVTFNNVADALVTLAAEVIRLQEENEKYSAEYVTQFNRAEAAEKDAADFLEQRNEFKRRYQDMMIERDELKVALDMAVKEVAEWAQKFGKEQYESDKLRARLKDAEETLESISDDCETKTAGCVGMKRLARYAERYFEGEG